MKTFLDDWWGKGHTKKTLGPEKGMNSELLKMGKVGNANPDTWQMPSRPITFSFILRRFWIKRSQWESEPYLGDRERPFKVEVVFWQCVWTFCLFVCCCRWVRPLQVPKGCEDILFTITTGQGQRLLSGKFISLIWHCMKSIPKRKCKVWVSWLLNRKSYKKSSRSMYLFVN